MRSTEPFPPHVKANQHHTMLRHIHNFDMALRYLRHEMEKGESQAYIYNQELLPNYDYTS